MSHYNPSNIFARARLVQTRHVTEYSPTKTGEYQRIYPDFQICARCVKDLKDNKHDSLHLGRKYINNSLHLARKYARIFVRGHYLFREANSFPRAQLEEKCELRGTDNVQGQISEHIFAPNGDYRVYYPSNLLCNARRFENRGIFSDIPQF